MTNETFHLVIIIPIITNSIAETEEAFGSKDFSALDVFHVLVIEIIHSNYEGLRK